MQAAPSPDSSALAARRAAIASHPRLFGVDSAEAHSVASGWEVRVRFVRKVGRSVPDHLTAQHVVLRTAAGTPSGAVVSGVAAPESAVVIVRLDDPRHELAGDFIVDLTGAPDIDPLLARATVVLGSSNAMAVAPLSVPGIAEWQLLAKDFNSFRRLMFERLSASLPAWTERHPADVGVTLVELLAYEADNLSYYQDAVATEAYLHTARSIVSARRHARLLDYHARYGRNTRVWVQIQVDDDAVVVPRGLRLLTRRDDDAPVRVALDEFDASPPGLSRTTVFETLHGARLWQGHNSMPLYAWGGGSGRLDAGATSAALDGHVPTLMAGDVLIFTSLPTRDGLAIDDVAHRHPVRLLSAPELSHDPLYDQPITLIRWGHADRLPFDLPIGSTGAKEPLSAVLGNIVLADHGCTVPAPVPNVAGSSRFSLTLPARNVLCGAPYDEARTRQTPAAAAMQQASADVQPLVTLEQVSGNGTLGPGETAWWRAVPDLLQSSRFARDFVAELGDDGTVALRFGDGRLGRRPAPEASFRAMLRVSRGENGHVGPDTIVHVVTDDERLVAVRNPLAAVAGASAETLESIRVNAPVAFRQQERVVVLQDFVDAAESVADVEEAVAVREWTGGWPATVVRIRRRDGARVDPPFLARVSAFLNERRLVDEHITVHGPETVPVVVALRVEAAAGVVPARLLHLVDTRLSSREPNGFFFPGRFGFGQPLYASAIVAAVMDVRGVANVTLTRLARKDDSASAPAVSDVIAVGPHEVVTVHVSASVAVEATR